MPDPVVVVLHTVLVEPTPHQRKVLEQVMELAHMVVVPTHAARARLLAVHEVLPERTAVIPHGAVSNVAPVEDRVGDPRIATWGLIGPGKGLEYGVEAMRYLQDLDPAPVYTIAGGTHPKVRAREGERYRDDLKKQASDLGVSESVVFEDGYLDPDEIRAMARAADVILLPYESREQTAPACSSRRSPPARRSWRPPSPTRSSSCPARAGSWCRTRSLRRWRGRSAGCSPTAGSPSRCGSRRIARPRD